MGDLKGGLTLKEIDALKKKHKAKKLTFITVETDEGEELYFWLKKPDMQTLSAVASFAEKDPIKAAQVMFKNCLVHGDASYENDADIFPSISEHMHVVMSKAKSKVEKF